MTKPWLDELNKAQRGAVTHGEGPLLVIAGAGTGKTKTLACRVAYLIDRGVRPDRILLLTFTRRAAAEMISRAGHLIGAQGAGGVWGGTFHAVANRLLRIYGRAIGIDADFTVIDQTDAADIMNLIRGEQGLAKKDRRFPRKETLIKVYSHVVNAQAKLKNVLKKHFPWCRDDGETIKSIFDAYTRRKRASNVLDYDDLLLFWRALCASPEAGADVADRFEHILVDEYQDTNVLQAEILRAMRHTHSNIMVVGDDAQSIYSFRAATIRNILDFPKQFRGTRQVTLDQNYRSTKPILAASNAVMRDAHERYTKDLWSRRPSEQKPVLTTCVDEQEQCQAVCRNILEHFEQGIPLMHQAVLFRAGHHSAQLEVELARRNIPFHKYGGLKFVEAAHVKDMLAFLRILENPHDEISWFRVLQLLQGIGPKTARRIMDHLNVRRQAPPPTRPGGTGTDGATPESPMRRLLAAPPQVPPAARDEFADLRKALADCLNGKETLPVVSQIERIRTFYEPIFSRLYENASLRLRDLEQLELIAAGYSSRSRFITDLTLDPPTATSDLAGAPFLEEDYLILSTIHSAKGCEWTVVHIIHAADGMIPSDMATGDTESIDEERRLFYVAMTRAKDNLYVYFPLRYYHVGRGFTDAHSYAQLTRFMPADVCDRFEQRSAGSAEQIQHGPSAAREVDDFLSRLWGD